MHADEARQATAHRSRVGRMRSVPPVDEEGDETVGGGLRTHAEPPVEAFALGRLATHRDDRAGVEAPLAGATHVAVQVRAARGPGDQAGTGDGIQAEGARPVRSGRVRVGRDQLDVGSVRERQDGVPAAQPGVPAALPRRRAESRPEGVDPPREIGDGVDQVIDRENRVRSRDRVSRGS